MRVWLPLLTSCTGAGPPANPTGAVSSATWSVTPSLTFAERLTPGPGQFATRVTTNSIEYVDLLDDLSTSFTLDTTALRWNSFGIEARYGDDDLVAASLGRGDDLVVVRREAGVWDTFDLAMNSARDCCSHGRIARLAPVAPRSFSAQSRSEREFR